MRLGSLTLGEVRQRLQKDALLLDIPPYLTVIGCREPGFAEALYAMYADYRLLPAEALDESFQEVHLHIARTGPLGRFGPHRQIALGLGGNFPFNPLPLGQAFPMFEWALNWCVTNYLHTRITFHAAGLGFTDSQGEAAAIILPGAPGAGKSTLTAAALERNFTLFSDELCLLDPETGTLLPVPRPISLKGASINVIRHRQPAAILTEPVHDTTKGTVAHVKPPTTRLGPAGREATPRLVIFPRFSAGAALACEPVPTGRALLRLAEQSFNLNLHGEEGFFCMTRLMQGIEAWDLTYGDLDAALDWMEQLSGEVT